MNINYENLFAGLQSWLLDKSPTSTVDITSSIKDYFSNEYKNYTVLPNNNSGEYLLDIMVTSFTPLKIIDNNESTLSITNDPIEVYIAVESELGGTGGSSAYGVHKNVVEDYLKLLLINSKYKIMVFTSLPYTNEEDHVEKRIDNLKDLYLKVCRNKQGILLIHLPGSQPNSNQVQASVHEITGYIISGDGKTVRKP